jgi:hypothetical protein
MDDLRSQLAALDHIAVPDQWPEIKRRSWAPTTPTVSIRTRWVGSGEHPQRRTSPMLTPIRVLAVGLVAAISAGVLAVSLSGPSSSPAGLVGAPGTSSGVPAAVASPAAVSSPGSGQPIDWDTGCVHLTADWLRIVPDAPGEGPDQIFTGERVAVKSDPGDDTYRTLEATWLEDGSEMRVNLYLAADEDSWWVRELRTYDGQPTPDWITYRGPLFEAPLGQSYGSDVMLESTEGNVPGRVEIRGMMLSAPDFGPGTGPATCSQTTPVGNIEFGTAEASPNDGTAGSPPTVGKTPDGMAPAVAEAVAAISDELLEGCYTRDEAVVRLSAALLEAGGSGFFVRTDGPIGGPDDRIDEIMAHVDAGCVVYGGSGTTEDGTPVFYVGGGSGGPTGTFVPDTVAE